MYCILLFTIIIHIKPVLTTVLKDFGTKGRIKLNISFQLQITEFCDLCRQPGDFHTVLLYSAVLSYNLDLYSVEAIIQFNGAGTITKVLKYKK